MTALKHLLVDDSGQDMVEYGLLSALLSIVAIVTLKSIAPLIRVLYYFKKSISSAG